MSDRSRKCTLEFLVRTVLLVTDASSELALLRQGSGGGKVSEPQSVGASAVPPNRWMELTVKSVTPLARRRARVAPLLPAAHPRC